MVDIEYLAMHQNPPEGEDYLLAMHMAHRTYIEQSDGLMIISPHKRFQKVLDEASLIADERGITKIYVKGNCAQQMVTLYQREAERRAARHADAMLGKGDLEGFIVWRRIEAAVRHLARKRRVSEPLS